MVAFLIAAGAGLLAGSFLNVCIHRWPIGESVVAPRSRCPRCSAPVRWFDNLPVASFVLLRGRCRTCRQRISWRYPLVELATGSAFALVVSTHGTGIEAVKLAVLASMLIVLYFTDVQHLILPDRVTLPGIAAGFGFSWFVPLRLGMADGALVLAGLRAPEPFRSAAESALSAAVLGGILLLVSEAFYRLRKIEGLGLGDVKLVSMIAAFQGSSETLLVVIVASILATAWGVGAALARRRGWREPLPYGSYLCAAAAGSIFLADAVLIRYWEFVLR